MNKRTEKKAIIFIGLQASGKSTFYRQRLAKDYVHINLDTLHTRNKEKIGTKSTRYCIRSAAST